MRAVITLIVRDILDCLCLYKFNNIVMQVGAVQTAVNFIKNSNSLLIATGAGMGKDSGLPDFRGDEGFWNNYPPYRGKFNFYQCANPAFLLYQPHLFWGFYGSRLSMYRQKAPHQGYRMLLEMADKIADPNSKERNYFAVTSNVDGHFQAAGFPEQNVLQMHGSIHRLQCYSCQKIIENKFIPEVNYEEMSCKKLPQCPGCRQVMRPNILMFNDGEWIEERTEEQQANYSSFIKKKGISKLAIIEIGAGMAVPSIRNMCEHLLYKYQQSKLIRINTDPLTSSASWLDNKRYIDVPYSALQAISKIRERI